MKKKLLFWAEIFWIVFSAFGLGLMIMAWALTKTNPTSIDKQIMVALALRIIISIWWLYDLFKDQSE